VKIEIVHSGIAGRTLASADPMRFVSMDRKGDSQYALIQSLRNRLSDNRVTELRRIRSMPFLARPVVHN
jgi:hypothetical protein